MEKHEAPETEVIAPETGKLIVTESCSPVGGSGDPEQCTVQDA